MKRSSGLQDRIAHRGCTQVASRQDLVELLQPELLVLGVHGLGDAVGVEHQDVAGTKSQRRLGIVDVLEEPQGRPSHVLERIDPAQRTPLQLGRIMPGAAVGELATTGS